MILRIDTDAPPFKPASDSAPDLRRSAKLLTHMRGDLARSDFLLVGTYKTPDGHHVELYEHETRHPTTIADVDGVHVITEWEVDYHDRLVKHGMEGFAKWLQGKPKIEKRKEDPI